MKYTTFMQISNFQVQVTDSEHKSVNQTLIVKTD